jgi:hypothetical protein
MTDVQSPYPWCGNRQNERDRHGAKIGPLPGGDNTWKPVNACKQIKASSGPRADQRSIR